MSNIENSISSVSRISNQIEIFPDKHEITHIIALIAYDSKKVENKKAHFNAINVELEEKAKGLVEKINT